MEKADPTFDIKDYLQRFLRIWPLIILSVIVFLLASIAYLRYYSVPSYHINAKVLINDENSSSGNNAAPAIDLSLMFGAKNSVDNEIEVLKTRSLMEALVSDLNLHINWFHVGSIKDVEIFEHPLFLYVENITDEDEPLTFLIEDINTEGFSLGFKSKETGEFEKMHVAYNKSITVPKCGVFRFKMTNADVASFKGSYRLLINTIDDQVEDLRKRLLVNLTNKMTSVIDLQLNYPIKEKGEFILEHFIQKYVEESIRDKSRIADSTIAFIDDRILLVSAELAGIEGNIQKFMQGRGITNLTAQTQILLENSSQYAGKVADIMNRVEILEAIGETISRPNGKSLVSGSVLGAGPVDPGFGNLVSSYNNLILEKEKLAMVYTADNPYIVNIDKQIESAKQNISDYIANTKESLLASVAGLERNTNKIEGDIRQVPEKERAFLDLSRQQQLKQELYLFLLQKREETALSNTSNIAGIRRLDNPKAEKLPFSPNKRAILAFSFLIGLILPAIGLYVSDSMNTTINSRKDIEKRTNLPVVAELQHNDAQKDLIEFDNARSALAEQFRGLRTNLQFLMPQDMDKVILVTSGMPGEGKSFISLNLANVYAASGLRVLLLEFDLRKPKLSKTYTDSKGLGISNFIVNANFGLNDIIAPVPSSDNLMFGACGPIPPNPSELIMNPRTAELFKQAREQFDIVIVDAPPIGAVTDGQLLSEFSDVALYVVRAGYTPKDLVSLPEDMRREGKIKNLNIVLNDVSAKNKGYYGYTYGYYGQEETKKSWLKRNKS